MIEPLDLAAKIRQRVAEARKKNGTSTAALRYDEGDEEVDLVLEGLDTLHRISTGKDAFLRKVPLPVNKNANKKRDDRR